MKTIELCDSIYASKWGLTDLYLSAEEKLRQLIAYGENFVTEWCGSQKELMSARYTRENGVLRVGVSQWMDDCEDGTYDLLHDAMTQEEDDFVDGIYAESEELYDSFMQNILDTVMDGEYYTEITMAKELPGDATYDDVMLAVGELEDATHEALERVFEENVKPTTHEIITAFRENPELLDYLRKEVM